MAKNEFRAKGFLEKSYLDKEGGKHITFELSSEYALEIAKLELMGRDLINHLPILLDISIKQNLGNLSNGKNKTKAGIKRRNFKG